MELVYNEKGGIKTTFNYAVIVWNCQIKFVYLNKTEKIWMKFGKQ